MGCLPMRVAAVLLSLGTSVSAAALSVRAPAEQCPAEVFVTLIPYEIHTSVLSNTIVSITPGITLTVTNAPVCISTLTTATITGSTSYRPRPTLDPKPGPSQSARYVFDNLEVAIISTRLPLTLSSSNAPSSDAEPLPSTTDRQPSTINSPSNTLSSQTSAADPQTSTTDRHTIPSLCVDSYSCLTGTNPG